MLLSTQNAHLMGIFDAETSIDILKKAGYDAIDMSLFGMSKDDSVFNSDAYKTRTLEIRTYADRAGIAFNQSHVPFVFNWRNENEYEERFFPRQVRALEITALLGGKIAIVHPIHHQQYLGHEEERFEENMKFYRALLPYAREYDVKIALENMWQNEPKRKCIGDDVCSRAAEFCRYLDTLNDEHFVACLDVGHCGIVGEEAQDAIRVLGHDRLHALHVHDNNYRADSHTLPGMGDMNWEEIMKALAEIDYDGELTFEADNFLGHFPRDFKLNAAKFMVDMGRYLIGRYDFYRAELTGEQ